MTFQWIFGDMCHTQAPERQPEVGGNSKFLPIVYNIYCSSFRSSNLDLNFQNRPIVLYLLGFLEAF